MQRSAVDVVVGAQYGDEGKGRIVDYLCLSERYDACVRVNGSDNAGHSVVLDSGQKIAFNQIPIGAIHGMKCLIARGCVVDLRKLDEEIGKVMGIIGGNGDNGNWVLYLDGRCHVKTQLHRERDNAEEAIRINPLGTTLSGNGPAYSDKYARKSFRVCDVCLDEYRNIQRRCVVADTSMIVTQFDNVLIEGAHGIMLDIDHGTYPFCTSSGCTAASACHSLGISPHKVGRSIGVIKPYLTRIGAGAFPTEISDEEVSSEIREKGHEYGTVTGRPRRIGWLDLPALAYAARVGGLSELALCKVDMLGDFDFLPVCVEYEGISFGYIPPVDEEYGNVKPIYIHISWDHSAVVRLIDLIEDKIGLPVTFMSYGEKRGSGLAMWEGKVKSH